MSVHLYYPEAARGFLREELETQGAKQPDGAQYERQRQYAVGEPIDIPYLSTDYTGSGSVTWTVLPRHVNTAAYDLVGMRMTLALYIVAFTVAGTGNVWRFKIPGGFKARYTMFAHTARIVDNGTATTGVIGTTADGDYLAISRTDSANFTASAENSSLQVACSFWVKSQAI